MILKFSTIGVRRLVDHAKAATSHRETYGSPPDPGLILVGDQGVYLMSSGIPDLRDGDKPVLVYAEGINPEVDDFDAWWDAKRASFGPDDGTDLLPIDDIEAVLLGWESVNAPHVKLDVTPGRLGLLVPDRTSTPRRKVAATPKRKGRKTSR